MKGTAERAVGEARGECASVSEGGEDIESHSSYNLVS